MNLFWISHLGTGTTQGEQFCNKPSHKSKNDGYSSFPRAIFLLKKYQLKNIEFRCKIKFGPKLKTDPVSIFNGFFVELWSSFAVEFWARSWILTPSLVAIPRVEHMKMGKNSTLNKDPGSTSWIWPRVRLPRWNVTPTPSQFTDKSWLRVTILCWTMTRVTIQRGIMTRGHNSTLNNKAGSKST